MRPSRCLLVPICLWLCLQLGGCSKNEAQALAAAKARIEKREDAGAEIDLKNLLQRFPKSGEARFLLGLQSQKRGDLTAALIELQRALDLHYADSLVVPAIARALMGQGKNRQVIEDFGKTSLSDANTTADLQALVAQAMAAEGDADGAKTLIDKTVAGAPSSELALLTQAGLQAQAGHPDLALVTLDRLIAARPDSNLAWGMKASVLGQTPGRTDLAMAAFRKALAIKPGDVAAQTGLVALTMQTGDLEAARKALGALRKIAPKQLNTKYQEANLAYATGKYSEAQSLYQAVLKVVPLHPDVLLNAAETELKLNAMAQAETMAAKAMTQAPASVRARQVLAQVYLRMSQPAKAIATLSSLIDGPSATPELLALAAQAQLMNGNTAAADEMYTRMAKLKPSDPGLRTLIATSGFGKASDETVFTQLQQIANEDTGSSADLAIITAHLGRQQNDAALQALAALERKRPGDPMLAHLRGQILAKKSDLAGARQSFENALKIDTGYFPATAALAALDFKDNKADLAQQRFKDFLKLRPNDARALLAIAELMERQQKPRAEVHKQIEAAVKAAPGDLSARMALISHLFASGQYDAALTAARAATAAIPDSIELLELQARCMVRVNQIQQALSSYGKIIALYPKSPRGHVGMADIYLQTNDLDQAQRSAERALELSPGLVKAKAQTFLVALRRKKFDQAVLIARTMQADHPRDGTGLLLEAEAESSRANWPAATGVLRNALDKPAPELAAIKLYAALMQGGKAGEADGFAQQWLKGHPEHINFLLSTADSARKLGHSAIAEQRYRQLLAAQPNHVPALNNLAMTLLQQNKPGATAYAEQAVRLAPERAEILDTLAQALASENQLSKAVETQRRALALAPEITELRLNLAGLLIQAGDKNLARSELDVLAKMGASFARQDEVARLRLSLASALPGR